MWHEIWARLQPSDVSGVGTTPVLVALGIAVLVVAVNPIWRAVRIAGTVVHELGHATVGVMLGRRFTGFVLRPDMSGETVTVGKSHGPALVCSTWAGYPAPAVVGTALVFAAERGWAAPVLGAIGAVLICTLIMVRSAYTAAVIVLAAAAVGALWWWGSAQLQLVVTFALGVVLLLGAWRHIGAVAGRRTRGGTSDSGILARLTPLPALAWVGTFYLVAAAGTALVGLQLWSLLAR